MRKFTVLRFLWFSANALAIGYGEQFTYWRKVVGISVQKAVLERVSVQRRGLRVVAVKTSAIILVLGEFGVYLSRWFHKLRRGPRQISPKI
jgi:hypothetical protein